MAATQALQQIDVLPESLLGMGQEFPERVWLLHHPKSGRYGCYCYEKIHGLACFSEEVGAFRFAEWIELGGMIAVEVSFDEAREIAKTRPAPVVCLILLDSMTSPLIHYVR